MIDINGFEKYCKEQLVGDQSAIIRELKYYETYYEDMFEYTRKVMELVEEFIDYTTEISITENELFSYLDDKYKNLKEYEDYMQILRQEIAYDFIFNIRKIEKQIENDLEVYGENTLEYKAIQEMIIKIKKVFPNFEI